MRRFSKLPINKILTIHRRTDRIAHQQLVHKILTLAIAHKAKLLRAYLRLDGQHAVVHGRGDPDDGINLLRVALVRVGVPKRDQAGVLGLGGLQVAHGFVEITPRVIWPDVGEIDERIDREGDSERFALPGKAGNLFARDFEGSNVLERYVIETFKILFKKG